MKSLPIKKIFFPIFAILLTTSFTLIIVNFFLMMRDSYRKVYRNVYQEVISLKDAQKMFEDQFEKMLFEDHLQISENLKLQSQVDALDTQLEELLTVEENENYSKLLDIRELYEKFSQKVDRNKGVSLDVNEYTDSISGLGESVINDSYDEVIEDITENNTKLDEDYDEYLASLPPPPKPNEVGEGYSYQTVTNERGTFGVSLIKVPLSSVKVVTAAASGDDCKNNCPTKSLAQHVQDNGGYAGINGPYFCPPDYSSCSGKINSSDYAFYKSSSDKWLNEDALSWGDTGLATFKEHSAKFYKKSSSYDGDSVTAGVSNYPTLLDNREVVVNNDKLTSYQKDVRGPRGVIGVGGTNLYLAVVYGATVKDAAYVMKTLGVIDALNLDGGGSSAMYINGKYVVGPGRSLPNAIVLVK